MTWIHEVKWDCDSYIDTGGCNYGDMFEVVFKEDAPPELVSKSGVKDTRTYTNQSQRRWFSLFRIIPCISVAHTTLPH